MKTLLHSTLFMLAVGLVSASYPSLAEPQTISAGSAISDKETLAAVRKGIVEVNVYDARSQLVRTGTGYVIETDRYNGFVMTNASVIEGAVRLSVIVGTGREFHADVIRSDASVDYVLLRVTGLDAPAIEFAATSPQVGDIVWSLMIWPSDHALGVSKGNVLNSYQVQPARVSIFNHSATPGYADSATAGSVLVNQCGQVVGLNMSLAKGVATQRALDGSSLRTLLAADNVRVTQAEARCLTDVGQVREQAEQASAEARRASEEAARAQQVARDLEKRLQASNQRNESLEGEARVARQRADEAMKAAAAAQENADATRLELERQTASIKAETEAMMKFMERDRQQQEKRFQEALREQRAEAATNTRLLLIAAGIIVLAIVIAGILLRVRGNNSASKVQRAERPGVSSNTEMHKQELVEYVLDGRDEDGIRYLLRISGDQLVSPDGVIIGRNPQDSPYIINHGDVSRKHARMKVMKNRVFIEDLGSTNGTSVNGQSIDDKGPVSINNGDQIIIGSVVMKLRVLGA